MKITYKDISYDFDNGMTLLEISNKFKEDYKFDILIAKVGNEIKELNEVINYDCKVTFYDLMHHQGNKAYERGLLFIFIEAVRKVLDCGVKVKHSIDKGVCYEIDKEISANDIVNIKEEMQYLINMKIPFEKISFIKKELINYYNDKNMFDKSNILKYSNKEIVYLYRLEESYNYFYGVMPLDTSYMKYFDLSIIDNKNIVLLFPSIYTNGIIKKYDHSDKVYNAFKENYLFGKENKVNNISELNDKINNIQQLIDLNEKEQNNRLMKIAEDIYNKQDKKIILIAGPSSSGKTTTANKLGKYLTKYGLQPKSISIDDYFVNREDTPRDEFGNYDFECINAIDLDLFNNNLNKLLNGEEIIGPTFSFTDGKREYNNKMKLFDNEILIIEGLHALNDELTKNIEENYKYKIYVSPFLSLNIDNHNRISTTDLRLLRRIVRDNRTRGYDISKTLQLWKNVRKGEEKYVFPFKDKNDVLFDTSFIYEIGVLKYYIQPLINNLNEKDINYSEALRLKELLENVLPIKGIRISEDSLLREFIGEEDRSDNMAIRVAINGFGRIGRLAFRRMFGDSDFEIVAINDLTDAKTLAHLLKYDTAQGRYKDNSITNTDNSIIVDGKDIKIFSEKEPNLLPWRDLNIDVVFECTGFFTSKEKCDLHIQAGAKKVILSAAGTDMKTIVYNVNHNILDGTETVVSCASCTTNCLAPMAKILNDNYKIKYGLMTTIHAYTNDQNTLDSPHRKGDLRRARAAASNVVPNSTGAAKAIGLVIPELEGKLNGGAQRIPVITGSLTELTCVLDKQVTKEEINELMKNSANETLNYNEDEIVSSDVIGTTCGSLFDATQTRVLTTPEGQMVRTVAWYDNEMGYTCQMIRTAKYLMGLK